MNQDTVPTDKDIALAFLQACDGGKGWDACLEYCQEDASFSCQAEPLTQCTSLASYAEWMKGVVAALPDAHVTVKAVTSDSVTATIMVYAIFCGTHTGETGPLPPTDRSTTSDYVYSLRFSHQKVAHVTKIWNANWSMRELGWI